MRDTKIYYSKKIKPKAPVMIVGLPGIGNVGSLVGEHIRAELGGVRFASLYSAHFPHHVVMMKNGMARPVSNRFYYIKRTGKMKSDLVILVGDFQAISPEGQYEVNEKIVRFFKKIGGERIYTIGGYSTSQGYVQHPKVFGVASSKKLVGELKAKGIVFGKAQGLIMGSAGLIVTMARKNHVDAACVMGETGMLEVDANSAKAVIDVMKNILHLDLDLKNIEKIKSETDKMLKSMMEAQANQEQGPPPNKDVMSYIR